MKGKKGALVEALSTVGFLDKVETVEGAHYQVHDWLEHAGHLSALKIRARANAEKRWANLKKDHAAHDATSIPSSSATAMLHLNLLNPPNLLNPLSPPGAGAPPPTRKCAAHDQGEPCQGYAMTGSRYCASHKEFYVKLQDRMKGKVGG